MTDRASEEDYKARINSRHFYLKVAKSLLNKSGWQYLFFSSLAEKEQIDIEKIELKNKLR